MNNIQHFKELGFGMMVHFGLYSILGGEWRGKRMDYIGEWVMSKYEIPICEYEKLAGIFNPIYFQQKCAENLCKSELFFRPLLYNLSGFVRMARGI